MAHLLLSHSSQKLGHACWRRFQFRKLFEHGRRETSLAAARGSALHRGMQTYLMTRDEDAAVVAFMLAYPIHMCQDPGHPDSLEACYQTLMAMINSMAIVQYELATVRCLDGEVRQAIEVPFEIVLEGYNLAGEGESEYTVSYIGYIDAIFYDTFTGEYAVVDIKTTQRKNMNPEAQYLFSEQCIPYGLVLEYMQGHPIKSFDVKYLSCQVDLLDPNCQLHSYPKTADDIEDWYRGLLVDLANIRMFLSMDWFPRTGGGTSCMSWNRRCEFFDLCSVRDKAIVQKILKAETEAAAADEATQSKLGREEFKPWVRFNVKVPV